MRMLAISSIATLVALVVAGWAITGVLERFVIGGLDQRLDSEITLLASTVDEDGRVDRALLNQRLGAFDAGPNWRWRIDGPDAAIGSSDFPPLTAGPMGPPAPPAGPDMPSMMADHDRLNPLDGASDDGVDVHARALTLKTSRGIVTLTVAAPRDVISRPIRGAVTPLLAALAVLALLLGAAALLQLRLGLRPIRRLRDQVASIRSGRREAVDEDQILELRPLALELNALTQDNARALSNARQSAANLAHALKTPVATLALGVRGQTENTALVERIDGIIRHHLGRARALAHDHRNATPLASAIHDLIDTVRLLHSSDNVTIESDVERDLVVAVDLQDCQELIGNLLDNAAKHARARVHLKARRDPVDLRRVLITITDDGAGVPESERSRIMLPGVRLDEQGDGHGFGLAIVSELAGLCGGLLELGASPQGGLSATLSLPATLA